MRSTEDQQPTTEPPGSARQTLGIGLALMVIAGLLVFAVGIALWYMSLRLGDPGTPLEQIVVQLDRARRWMRGTAYVLMGLGFLVILGYRLVASSRGRRR